MNANFYVIGLTRLGIKPKSAQADALTTRYLSSLVTMTILLKTKHCFLRDFLEPEIITLVAWW